MFKNEYEMIVTINSIKNFDKEVEVIAAAKVVSAALKEKDYNKAAEAAEVVKEYYKRVMYNPGVLLSNFTFEKLIDMMSWKSKDLEKFEKVRRIFANEFEEVMKEIEKRF